MSNLGQQRGQVGIIVLLLAAVVLVIGLTVANRTVRESQSTVQQEDSARVFNTAEAGIEEALNNIFQFEKGLGTLSDQLNLTGMDTLNQVNIESLSNFSGYLRQGEILGLNVVSGETGNITIDWSTTNCAQGASNLLLSIYYNNGGSYQSNHYAVGNCPRFDDQNLIGVTNISTNYRFRHTLAISGSNNQNAFVRIMPIESDTDLSINAASNLLSDVQYNITSAAQNQSGTSAKTLEVTQSSPAAPSFMDFALLSGGTLNK